MAAADRYMVFIPGSSSPPQGPVELGELTRRFHSREMPPGAKVAKVGDTSWLPIEHIVPRLIEEEAKTIVAPLQFVVPEKTYEVTVDGEHVVGPVTLDQLRRGVEAGKLPEEAKVRVVGEATWRDILDLIQTEPPAAKLDLTVPSPSREPTRAAPTKAPSAVNRLGSRPWILPVVASCIVVTLGSIIAVIAISRKTDAANPSPAASSSAVSAHLAPSSEPAPRARNQIEIVLRGLVNPQALAVSNATLFVTVHGKPASKEDADGSIVSLALDGKSEPRTIVKNQVFPSMLVIDQETLFWLTLDRKVVRSSTSGSGTKTIHKFESGLPLLVGVDAKEVFVATNKLSPGDGEGRVVAVRRDGTKARDLYEGPAITSWALGKDEVFFCQAALGHIPKKGSSEGVVLERGMGARGDAGLCHESVADGRRVFWHQGGSAGGIRTWDLDKGGATTLAVETADRLAVAGDYIYWSYQERRGPGRIHRVSVAGGPVESVVEGATEITEFVVSFPFVYWTSKTAGTVSRALLPGASTSDAPKPKPKIPKVFPFICPPGSFPLQSRGGCSCRNNDTMEMVDSPGPPAANCFTPPNGGGECRWQCE